MHYDTGRYIMNDIQLNTQYTIYSLLQKLFIAMQCISWWLWFAANIAVYIAVCIAAYIAYCVAVYIAYCVAVYITYCVAVGLDIAVMATLRNRNPALTFCC